MQCANFEIYASPFMKAYCPHCADRLHEVSNGLFGHAMYCPKCKRVFMAKLIAVPKKKISKEYLKQCEDEINGIRGKEL